VFIGLRVDFLFGAASTYLVIISTGLKGIILFYLTRTDLLLDIENSVRISFLKLCFVIYGASLTAGCAICGIGGVAVTASICFTYKPLIHTCNILV
jgi:hypothetical protein